MTSIPRRLRWLFLTLLLFGGGGASLPWFDAVLRHWQPNAHDSSRHIEAANGCGHHVDHCGISCPTSASEALHTPAATSVLVSTTVRFVSRSAPLLPERYAGRIGFLSRAPPTHV